MIDELLTLIHEAYDDMEDQLTTEEQMILDQARKIESVIDTYLLLGGPEWLDD